MNSRIQKMYPIIVLFFLAFAWAVPVRATWSIVAVDPVTREVGSAGASYTPAVWPILGIVGGQGVVVAQGASNENARVEAVRMIQEGRAPKDILAVITDPAFDPKRDAQQYGLVTLTGGSAAFTGENCMAWAGHAGDNFVMAQGNILVSEQVISETLTAYRDAAARGESLAGRLVAALVAGSNAGGDSRAGVATAMTAYVAVANPRDPAGKASFAIIVPPQGAGVNPTTVLAAQYERLKDRAHAVYFPSLKMLVLLLVALPVLAGLLVSIVIRVRAPRRHFGMKTIVHALISIGAAVAVFAFMEGITLLLSWAAPIYGVYAWMVPMIIAILTLMLFILVRTVYLIWFRVRMIS